MKKGKYFEYDVTLIIKQATVNYGKKFILMRL